MTSSLTRVARAAAKAASARHDRDAAIRAARPHHSLAEIAQAANLSRARVDQITKGR